MTKATITIQNTTYENLPRFVEDNVGFDIQLNIQNNDGSVYDLTGYTVRFKGRASNSSTTTINTLCTIGTATSGIATYTPTADDFADAGKYNIQVECSSATIITTVELGSMILNEAL